MELPESAVAAVDLVGRTGAKQLEIGYLHDTPRSEDAGWWATAKYRGARISVEDKTSPTEALEALAVKLFDGAKCVHCGGLVSLSRKGAMFYPGRVLADGSTFTLEEAKARPLCRWRRRGPKWVRGCEDQRD